MVEEAEGRRHQMTCQRVKMEGLMEGVEGAEGKRHQMTCRGVRMEGLMEAVEGVEGRRHQMICQEVRMEEPREAVEEAELWAWEWSVIGQVTKWVWPFEEEVEAGRWGEVVVYYWAAPEEEVEEGVGQRKEE